MNVGSLIRSQLLLSHTLSSNQSIESILRPHTAVDAIWRECGSGLIRHGLKLSVKPNLFNDLLMNAENSR